MGLAVQVGVGGCVDVGAAVTLAAGSGGSVGDTVAVGEGVAVGLGGRGVAVCVGAGVKVAVDRISEISPAPMGIAVGSSGAWWNMRATAGMFRAR